jgi:hypothetical protein
VPSAMTTPSKTEPESTLRRRTMSPAAPA